MYDYHGHHNIGTFDGDSYGGYNSIQLPVQPSIAQHYLAIAGVQPLVAQNPRVRPTLRGLHVYSCTILTQSLNHPLTRSLTHSLTHSHMHVYTKLSMHSLPLPRARSHTHSPLNHLTQRFPDQRIEELLKPVTVTEDRLDFALTKPLVSSTISSHSTLIPTLTRTSSPSNPNPHSHPHPHLIPQCRSRVRWSQDIASRRP